MKESLNNNSYHECALFVKLEAIQTMDPKARMESQERFKVVHKMYGEISQGQQWYNMSNLYVSIAM